ncbi:MAG: FeoC-like transcriptional regulator [Deltaproteobacteria bacterium]|nr:FeoC-like transcriptional regulator [Deltaproteobacteria bacterium]MBW2119370.1 FeoC-like transcriptional regulator [Deltaproteobacteria bacterium]MBW2345531.1 FeoC-like transcriptional regulator [Deltaproteobacteria bacterium]
MILADIKEYLSNHGMASLADLSVHFGVEPDAMRGMLDRWIRKGKLSRLPQAATCSKCCVACNSDHVEIYEWLG